MSILAFLTAFMGIWLLVRFQYDTRKVRKQIAAVGKFAFTGEERVAFDIKDDADPFIRGWEVLLALILVCVVGAFLVSYSLP